MDLLTNLQPFLPWWLGNAPPTQNEDVVISELASRYELLMKCDSERHMHHLAHEHFQSRHQNLQFIPLNIINMICGILSSVAAWDNCSSRGLHCSFTVSILSMILFGMNIFAKLTNYRDRKGQECYDNEADVSQLTSLATMDAIKFVVGKTKIQLYARHECNLTPKHRPDKVVFTESRINGPVLVIEDKKPWKDHKSGFGLWYALRLIAASLA